MAAPTAALDDNQNGPSPGPEGMVVERVKITGNTSVVGDTVAYVSSFLNDCKFVSPGYSFTQSLSGSLLTVTLKLEHAIAGTDIERCELVGYV